MKLRTSTAAGLAGVAVNVILQVLGIFEATADFAASPQASAIITPIVMFFVARVWKTPENPGPI